MVRIHFTPFRIDRFLYEEKKFHGKIPFKRNVLICTNVQVLEKNVMLETILRAYFEGVLIGMYTFAILEVFCGSYCSMIFRFYWKKVNFCSTLSLSVFLSRDYYWKNHGQKN